MGESTTYQERTLRQLIQIMTYLLQSNKRNHGGTQCNECRYTARKKIGVNVKERHLPEYLRPIVRWAR